MVIPDVDMIAPGKVPVDLEWKIKTYMNLGPGNKFPIIGAENQGRVGNISGFTHMDAFSQA
jgi:hypothetical protein